jgi:hypothetical protein
MLGYLTSMGNEGARNEAAAGGIYVLMRHGNDDRLMRRLGGRRQQGEGEQSGRTDRSQNKLFLLGTRRCACRPTVLTTTAASAHGITRFPSSCYENAIPAPPAGITARMLD